MDKLLKSRAALYGKRRRLTNSLDVAFVLIPAGDFAMGSLDSPHELARDYGQGSSAYDVEVPVHRVTITRAFFLAAHEVTLREFRQFVTATSYRTDGERVGGIQRGNDATGVSTLVRGLSWRNPGFAQTDDHPVVGVSWNDAKAFCEWLTSKEGVNYRLPTEAEWEYAARGGTESRFSCGNDQACLQTHANIADHSRRQVFPSEKETASWDDGFPNTSPVGKFRPNAFGLYDVLGNVYEWCEDRGIRKYSSAKVVDPHGSGPEDAQHLRGGSYFDGPSLQRISRRAVVRASSGFANVGFRVVRQAD